MSSAAKVSHTPRNPKVYRKIEMIKMHIDQLAEKLSKTSSLDVSRDDLAKFAKEVNLVIVNNRDAVRAHESYLKAALIDLTEIPEMNPHMQRISYITALKDASKNMQFFLDSI